MENLNEIYGERFFARRGRLNWRCPIVCNPIIDFFRPKRIVDVGCGNADLVNYFRERGIEAFGIEGSLNAKNFLLSKHVVFHDITIPIDWAKMPFSGKLETDLCICFEVAEHLPEEFTLAFVHNITNISNRVLISAAPPGQGGHHHVNCQPSIYWEGVFANFRFHRCTRPEEYLKSNWESHKKKPGVKAYYDNVLYFTAGGCPCSSSMLP
jgi:SAM-dependent methyltransferase